MTMNINIPFLLICLCVLDALGADTLAAAEPQAQPKVKPHIHTKVNSSRHSTDNDTDDRLDSRRVNTQNSSEARCLIISRNQAMTQAQAQIQGKIVGITLRRLGTSSVYRVRILDSHKRVKTVNIQACK